MRTLLAAQMIEGYILVSKWFCSCGYNNNGQTWEQFKKMFGLGTNR